MAQTSIIITSTDTNNKKLQKTLTYANANASSGVLKSVAQQLNALTTNTYEKTDRIDRINCDTEESGVTTKFTSTIDFDKTTIDLSVDDNPVTFGYDGDGTLYLFDFTGVVLARIVEDEENILIGDGSDGTFKVGATEGTNYYAPTPVTITVTNG